MLTSQLCANVESDRQRRAIDLEDTAVVVAPLIPWSIAGAVPLASVGRRAASLLFACLLYLLPLCRLVNALLERRRGGKTDAAQAMPDGANNMVPSAADGGRHHVSKPVWANR